MGNRFSSAKNSIAECDNCGFRYKLKVLKKLVVKTKQINMLVCPECWNPDHPQLQLGMYPVDDPQGVRDPRPDRSYLVSGLLEDGFSGEGSRVIQWGWGPVGGGYTPIDGGTPNYLVTQTAVGTVTIELDAIPIPPVGAVVETATAASVVQAILTALPASAETATAGDSVSAVLIPGTLDSIDPDTGITSSTITLTNSNLTFEGTVAYVWYGGKGVYWHTTGKKYFEITNDANVDACLLCGLGDASADFQAAGNYVGNYISGTIFGRSWGIWANRSAGLITYGDDTATFPTGTPITTGGRINVAVDFDAGKMWFGVDGAWINSSDPATGTSPIYTFTPNAALYAAISVQVGGQIATMNFGASAFTDTVPSGFSSWNTSISTVVKWDIGSVVAGMSLTNGNLTAQRTTPVTYPDWYGVTSVNAHSTGKRYFEITQDVYSARSMFAGVCQSFLDAGMQPYVGAVNYLGQNGAGWGVLFNDPAYVTGVYTYNAGTGTFYTTPPLLSNGGVVGVAVDFAAGKMWFSLNGTWLNSGNPAAGTNPTYTFTANTALLAGMCFYDNVAQATANFGATPFSGTVPSGFSSWNVIS